MWLPISIPNQAPGPSTTLVSPGLASFTVFSVTLWFAEQEEELMMTPDDDWAASLVARQLGETEIADHLLARSSSWKNLFNNATGFMEARNSDGSWAGEEVGWTEGDHWAYSLDVMVRPPFHFSIYPFLSSFPRVLPACSDVLSVPPLTLCPSLVSDHNPHSGHQSSVSFQSG